MAAGSIKSNNISTKWPVNSWVEMIAAQTIRFILVSVYPLVTSGVQKCYIGALEVYENPRCSIEGKYYKVTHYYDWPQDPDHAWPDGGEHLQDDGLQCGPPWQGDCPVSWW